MFVKRFFVDMMFLMKKILLISTLILVVILAFFVVDIWNTVNQKPNMEFGHLLLKDKT